MRAKLPASSARQQGRASDNARPCTGGPQAAHRTCLRLSRSRPKVVVGAQPIATHPLRGTKKSHED